MSAQTFEVWSPDWSETKDDARKIAAWDFEEAAQTFTERAHQEDPWDGYGLLVHVRNMAGEIKAFSVHPEPCVSFMAYEQGVLPS